LVSSVKTWGGTAGEHRDAEKRRNSEKGRNSSGNSKQGFKKKKASRGGERSTNVGRDGPNSKSGMGGVPGGQKNAFSGGRIKHSGKNGGIGIKKFKRATKKKCLDETTMSGNRGIPGGGKSRVDERKILASAGFSQKRCKEWQKTVGWRMDWGNLRGPWTFARLGEWREGGEFFC